MKRLAFLLMLLPSVAAAQVGPEVYKVATGAQIIAFNASTPVTITNALSRQMARVVCTAACYVSVNASGLANTVSSITGVYLPADVPMMFSISRNSKISILGFSGGGTANIIEMTK